MTVIDRNDQAELTDTVTQLRGTITQLRGQLTGSELDLTASHQQLEVERTRVSDLIREKTEAEVRNQELMDQADTARRERDAANERLDSLWESLGYEADRRDWCGEYDEFARAHGGPSRHADIDWSATFQIRAQTDWDLSMDNVEFPNGTGVLIRFSVGGVREGRRNQCVCDGYAAREAAHEALNNDDVEWDDLEIYEQHCDCCS